MARLYGLNRLYLMNGLIRIDWQILLWRLYRRLDWLNLLYWWSRLDWLTGLDRLNWLDWLIGLNRIIRIYGFMGINIELLIMLSLVVWYVVLCNRSFMLNHLFRRLCWQIRFRKSIRSILFYFSSNIILRNHFISLNTFTLTLLNEQPIL